MTVSDATDMADFMTESEFEFEFVHIDKEDAEGTRTYAAEDGFLVVGQPLSYAHSLKSGIPPSSAPVVYASAPETPESDGEYGEHAEAWDPEEYMWWEICWCHPFEPYEQNSAVVAPARGRPSARRALTIEARALGRVQHPTFVPSKPRSPRQWKKAERRRHAMADQQRAGHAGEVPVRPMRGRERGSDARAEAGATPQPAEPPAQESGPTSESTHSAEGEAKTPMRETARSKKRRQRRREDGS